MKLGIIGFGNMAEAILGGILANGFVAKEDVIASGKDEAMLAKASEKYGISVEADNKKLVEMSDVILLSVKPQIMADVIAEKKTKGRKGSKTDPRSKNSKIYSLSPEEKRLLAMYRTLDEDNRQKVVEFTDTLTVEDNK